MAPSEVISARKRDHEEVYGRSIIPKLIRKLHSIVGMDRMVSDLFVNREVASGIISVNTASDNLADIREQVESKTRNKSDSLAYVSVPGEQGANKGVHFQNITPTISTIPYVDFKQHAVREINTSPSPLMLIL